MLPPGQNKRQCIIDSSGALDFELQKISRKLNFGIWTSNIVWKLKQKVISSPKVGNILVLDTSLYLDTITKNALMALFSSSVDRIWSIPHKSRHTWTKTNMYHYLIQFQDTRIFIPQTLYYGVILHVKFCKIISFSINLAKMVKIQDVSLFLCV